MAMDRLPGNAQHLSLMLALQTLSPRRPQVRVENKEQAVKTGDPAGHEGQASASAVTPQANPFAYPRLGRSARKGAQRKSRQPEAEGTAEIERGLDLRDEEDSGQGRQRRRHPQRDDAEYLGQERSAAPHQEARRGARRLEVLESLGVPVGGLADAVIEALAEHPDPVFERLYCDLVSPQLAGIAGGLGGLADEDRRGVVQRLARAVSRLDVEAAARFHAVLERAAEADAGGLAALQATPVEVLAELEQRLLASPSLTYRVALSIAAAPLVRAVAQALIEQPEPRDEALDSLCRSAEAAGNDGAAPLAEAFAEGLGQGEPEPGAAAETLPAEVGAVLEALTRIQAERGLGLAFAAHLALALSRAGRTQAVELLSGRLVELLRTVRAPVEALVAEEASAAAELAADQTAETALPAEDDDEGVAGESDAEVSERLEVFPSRWASPDLGAAFRGRAARNEAQRRRTEEASEDAVAAREAMTGEAEVQRLRWQEGAGFVPEDGGAGSATDVDTGFRADPNDVPGDDPPPPSAEATDEEPAAANLSDLFGTTVESRRPDPGVSGLSAMEATSGGTLITDAETLAYVESATAESQLPLVTETWQEAGTPVAHLLTGVAALLSEDALLETPAGATLVEEAERTFALLPAIGALPATQKELVRALVGQRLGAWTLLDALPAWLGTLAGEVLPLIQRTLVDHLGRALAATTRAVVESGRADQAGALLRSALSRNAKVFALGMGSATLAVPLIEVARAPAPSIARGAAGAAYKAAILLCRLGTPDEVAAAFGPLIVGLTVSERTLDQLPLRPVTPPQLAALDAVERRELESTKPPPSSLGFETREVDEEEEEAPLPAPPPPPRRAPPLMTFQARNLPPPPAPPPLTSMSNAPEPPPELSPSAAARLKAAVARLATKPQPRKSRTSRAPPPLRPATQALLEPPSAPSKEPAEKLKGEPIEEPTARNPLPASVLRRNKGNING